MGMGDRECPKCGWEMYHDTFCSRCNLKEQLRLAVEALAFYAEGESFGSECCGCDSADEYVNGKNFNIGTKAQETLEKIKGMEKA